MVAVSRGIQAHRAFDAEPVLIFLPKNNLSSTMAPCETLHPGIYSHQYGYAYNIRSRYIYTFFTDNWKLTLLPLELAKYTQITLKLVLVCLYYFATTLCVYIFVCCSFRKTLYSFNSTGTTIAPHNLYSFEFWALTHNYLVYVYILLQMHIYTPGVYTFANDFVITYFWNI